MASGVSADKLGTFLGRVYKTVGERDALRAERDARYDCKGGPGTTAPECGGCATCLHRVIVGVEAERDALRAQLLSERERLERWLTAPDGKQYERGTVQAVFDECDALRAQLSAEKSNYDMLSAAYDHAKAEARRSFDFYFAQNKLLHSQVQAARTLCTDTEFAGGLLWPADLLDAMDKSKP